MYKPHSQISRTPILEAQDLEKKICQKFIAESFQVMNILAEMKSFSLRISDSICSLNKTQTRILILITSTKRYENILEHKTAFPDELFPSIFPVKAIQVRKFVSKFVRTFGCVSWLSSKAFNEKRESW